MKYYLFMDESGEHGLTKIDSDFPVFVLCGILIEESDYQKFSKQIDSLKEYFWSSRHVILHSRDIRKCDKEFSILFDLGIKEQFYQKLNKIISETPFVIISSAINKDNYVKRYGLLASNPYEICLSFIYERTVFCLQQHSNQVTSVEVRLESRGAKDDKELEKYILKLMRVGTVYVNSSAFKKFNFTHGFDAKRVNINGQQLADLVAYPIARHIINPLRPNPAFDLFADKFYQKDNKRYGLKIFP